MAVDYTKRINKNEAKQDKVASRQKRLKSEHKALERKYDKALRKAETEATWVLGKMLLRQFPDYRGINWSKLERYLTREATAAWFSERFYDDNYDEGKPYAALNAFKEVSNNVY